MWLRPRREVYGERAQQAAKERYVGSPVRPERKARPEDLPSTPEARTRSNPVVKSPLRRYWDKKSEDSKPLNLSPTNKEVRMDFTATSHREVEELRDQLKELRQLLELRSDRSRETGEPSKWVGKGINLTNMPMPIWDQKEHPKDPESFIREFET